MDEDNTDHICLGEQNNLAGIRQKSFQSSKLSLENPFDNQRYIFNSLAIHKSNFKS